MKITCRKWNNEQNKKSCYKNNNQYLLPCGAKEFAQIRIFEVGIFLGDHFSGLMWEHHERIHWTLNPLFFLFSRRSAKSWEVEEKKKRMSNEIYICRKKIQLTSNVSTSFSIKEWEKENVWSEKYTYTHTTVAYEYAAVFAVGQNWN